MIQSVLREALRGRRFIPYFGLAVLTATSCGQSPLPMIELAATTGGSSGVSATRYVALSGSEWLDANGQVVHGTEGAPVGRLGMSDRLIRMPRSMPADAWLPRVRLVCVHDDRSLEFHVDLGPFDPGGGVELTVETADGRIERAVAEPGRAPMRWLAFGDSFWRSLAVTDPADARRLADAAFRNGAVVSNGWFSFRNAVREDRYGRNWNEYVRREADCCGQTVMTAGAPLTPTS